MIAGVVIAASLALATLAPASPAASIPYTSAPAADPCAYASTCREFGSADVTGDGAVDRIGYRLIGYDEDRPFAPVTLRVVVTASGGDRYVFDSRHRMLFQGPYGATAIDGVPGAEIALSWSRGAHTEGIEVLTFRDGRLVREKGWVRDSVATYGVGVEWIPGETPTSPIMRRCAYEDVPVNGKPGTRTTTIDFTWQVDQWLKGPPTTADYALNQPIPWQCMRFRVPGLSRFPMNLNR